MADRFMDWPADPRPDGVVLNTFTKAAAILREAAETLEERGAVYGDNPPLHASLASLLLPGDMTGGEAQRLSMFNMMIIKMSRYSEAMPKGGHDDSLIDLINYTAALLVIDRWQRTIEA